LQNLVQRRRWCQLNVGFDSCRKHGKAVTRLYRFRCRTELVVQCIGEWVWNTNRENRQVWVTGFLHAAATIRVRQGESGVVDRSNNTGLATACPSEIQKRGARDSYWRRRTELLQANGDERTKLIRPNRLFKAHPYCVRRRFAFCVSLNFGEINARPTVRKYRSSSDGLPLSTMSKTPERR
jgi:hypothetical protein